MHERLRGGKTPRERLAIRLRHAERARLVPDARAFRAVLQRERRQAPRQRLEERRTEAHGAPARAQTAQRQNPRPLFRQPNRRVQVVFFFVSFLLVVSVVVFVPGTRTVTRLVVRRGHDRLLDVLLEVHLLPAPAARRRREAGARERGPTRARAPTPVCLVGDPAPRQVDVQAHVQQVHDARAEGLGQDALAETTLVARESARDALQAQLLQGDDVREAGPGGRVFARGERERHLGGQHVPHRAGLVIVPARTGGGRGGIGHAEPGDPGGQRGERAGGGAGGGRGGHHHRVSGIAARVDEASR
mmetsp:Transcript_14921/g.62984  ORF Transcript_14921/g.62984 Transcript_14921/m.62984 type:complete len:303 (+) Transcript_14921:920-1828(+)